MSRKTILTVVAVLGAVLAVFQSTFGLTLKGTAAAAGLGAILVYVFFEAKADRDRMKAQAARWKDPKFWLSVAAAAIAALGTSGVSLPIPPETITAILAAIVGVLFKAKVQTA